VRWVRRSTLCLILLMTACGSRQTSAVADLPLVEIAPPRRGATLAIIVSGDGGWRAIDRDVAAGLRARGYGVVGLVAPKFFAERRTPDEASRALERILAHYTAMWDPSRVIAVGYSRGAGVLPFMVNRLSPQWRSRVTMLALMGLEPTIDFYVTPFDLLRSEPTDVEVPIRGEVEKVRKRILCFYGEREQDSLCRELPLSVAIRIAEPGTHHFDVNHDVLARTIWSWSRI
jgi:type IV secretory pathway VirJ component